MFILARGVCKKPHYYKFKQVSFDKSIASGQSLLTLIPPEFKDFSVHKTCHKTLTFHSSPPFVLWVSHQTWGETNRPKPHAVRRVSTPGALTKFSAPGAAPINGADGVDSGGCNLRRKRCPKLPWTSTGCCHTFVEEKNPNLHPNNPTKNFIMARFLWFWKKQWWSLHPFGWRDWSFAVQVWPVCLRVLGSESSFDCWTIVQNFFLSYTAVFSRQGKGGFTPKRIVFSLLRGIIMDVYQ